MAVLKTLGELKRLRVVRLLLQEQLGVNALSERVCISPYPVSTNLRRRKEAGNQRLSALPPDLKDRWAANPNVLALESPSLP